MNLPDPPRATEPIVFERPVTERRPWSILPLLLLVAAFVGVLVWGLTDPPVITPAAPASSPVTFVPKPLTQAGADAAAGALLRFYHDDEHLNFVAWDIHRMTGCRPAAVNYVGPEDRTDPGSIPEDIDPTVIGRAHRGPERLTVWFVCKEEA